MATQDRRGIGAIDFFVSLITGAALAIFILWLGTRIVGHSTFETVPTYISDAFGKLWVLFVSGGGVIALAVGAWVKRDRLAPEFIWLTIGWMIGLPALAFSAAFAVKEMSPIAEQTSSGTSPKDFNVRFRVDFSDLPAASKAGAQPNVLFMQEEPETPETWPLSADPDQGYYKAPLVLSAPGKQVIAIIKRSVQQSGKLATDFEPWTDMRFRRKTSDPQDVKNAYAWLKCIEAHGCKVDPQDPGWVEDYTSLLHSPWTVPVVHAQDKTPTPSRPWIVPSLRTLQEKAQEWRVGYTEFAIRSQDPKLTENADYFTYQVATNQRLVGIDGSRPEFLRVPVDRTKAFELRFGLENLDFAGQVEGCDTIETELRVHHTDGKTSNYKLYREYVALRDADPLTITGSDGLRFEWSGKYVQPFPQWEVFVVSPFSGVSATQLKTSVDMSNLRYRDLEIRRQIRPPLATNAYGVAIGLLQPSGQIQFTFSQHEATEMLRWWNETGLSGLGAEVRRNLPPHGFLYAVRGVSLSSDRKVCEVAGIRP